MGRPLASNIFQDQLKCVIILHYEVLALWFSLRCIMASNVRELPSFLQTYEDLNNHIRDTLDDLDNTSKGRSFAQFVSKVISISPLGDRFIEAELGPDGSSPVS
jgi:hypothetical protein